METSELIRRLNQELGYEIKPTPIIPNTATITEEVKRGNQENTQETTKKPQYATIQERMKAIGQQPGQPSRNPKGRKKKPKDILKALAEQLEEIRAKNPDGTPGKTAAEIIAKNAIDLAVLNKDKEMIKWVTERIHGKMPNINQNQNMNIDVNDIINDARNVKIVENLDDEDAEPTVVEVLNQKENEKLDS